MEMCRTIERIFQIRKGAILLLGTCWVYGLTTFPFHENIMGQSILSGITTYEKLRMKNFREVYSLVKKNAAGLRITNRKIPEVYRYKTYSEA
ncbi:MAG: hypothetical protein M1113_00010 [Candidatus Thermoplasmatota archaeon]|nr:hypothetical protein [Candidatus Thermoplasmatota archaeon]